MDEEGDDLFNEDEKILDQNEASENFPMVLNERGIIQPPISKSTPILINFDMYFSSI